jgi:hypothetical protein
VVWGLGVNYPRLPDLYEDFDMPLKEFVISETRQEYLDYLIKTGQTKKKAVRLSYGFQLRGHHKTPIVKIGNWGNKAIVKNMEYKRYVESNCFKGLCPYCNGTIKSTLPDATTLLQEIVSGKREIKL